MGAMTEDSPDDLNSPAPEYEISPDAGPDLAPEPEPPPPIRWPRAETAPEQDIFGIPVPPSKTYPRHIPHLGHAALFFVIALVLMIVGLLIGTVVVQSLHLYPHHGFDWIFHNAATDARTGIPIQTFSYGLIVLVCVPLFSLLWSEPFGEGVHWNNRAAWSQQRRFFSLVILGLAAGTGISLIGNLLPMPSNPPITQDMMKSAAGAWLLLIFGITAAPLIEELAFRGFLLPGLLNAFRWFADRGILPAGAPTWIGIPFSIAVTSLAFAFMHSPQVSHAWGPLVLIGSVSIVLCIVRLAMNSVMASVIVHAAYNFTLFAGVLYQTSGFRHLERLKG
ncbi:MAG: CPBP family intramembrane glutamic endopeptidase [Acidobacteriaceae bacterium]